MLNNLACIDDDLGSITEHIKNDRVDAVDHTLGDLASEGGHLNNDNDNSHSVSISDSSTITPGSSSSPSLSSPSSTCIPSSTALQVTVQCIPTVLSSGSSYMATTYCSPLMTITASGCSATRSTTTISASSTSASASQVICASDTCGNACPMIGGPLSGASMAIAASKDDCASILTITTSPLPTASYGIARTTNVATPTPQSAFAPLSKRGLHSKSEHVDKSMFDHLLSRRALPIVKPPYNEYVQSLKVSWVDQTGDVSAQYFNYPDKGSGAAGINGIYGCTSVIVCSEKGVYISHIWENPVFISGNYVPTDDQYFTATAFNSLRDGTATTQSITALVGTDEVPGPLNAIYSPKVFVLTPFATQKDRDQYGITTKLRYEARAQQLAHQVVQIIPGSGGSGSILGYTRTGSLQSTSELGTAGRAILEADPQEYWLTSSVSDAAPGSSLQIGRWRLWVEDQLITWQDFWLPLASAPGIIQGRDDTSANPCAWSAVHVSSSLSSTGLSGEAFRDLFCDN